MTDVAALTERYDHLRTSTLVLLAQRIEDHIRAMLKDLERIDRVTARAKSTDRFVGKAMKIKDGVPRYRNPFDEIQDQVGARIVVLYLADVERISTIVERYLRPVESRAVEPENEREFGYFGKHYVLFIPSDLYDSSLPQGIGPRFFELQIKTLFQHAWSEAEHDLGYKPTSILLPEQKRKIAFTAAQAWGADRIFEELHRDLDDNN